MAYEIRWADNAIDEYRMVVDYLQKEWGEEIAVRFIEVMNHKVSKSLLIHSLGKSPARETMSGVSWLPNTTGCIIVLLGKTLLRLLPSSIPGRILQRTDLNSCQKKFARLSFLAHICIVMTKQIQNIQWWWHTNLTRGV